MYFFIRFDIRFDPLLIRPGFSSKCCFTLNSTADSRFIIMLMEADLRDFLNYGSGTQNESQACFSVGARMSGVCFNEPLVQG